MADVWAAFPDAPPSPPPRASTHGDDWDAFPDAKEGVANNFMAGVNEAIADAAGAPVDIVNWAAHHNPVSMAVNAAGRAFGLGDVDSTEAVAEAHQPKQPFGGSQSIKSAMGLIDANPDNVVANSMPERLARSAGAGAAMVAAPEFASRQASHLASSLYRAGKGAITGAASGVGSEGAREVAPEPLKPVASLVGGLGAGMLPGALGATAKAGARQIGVMSQASAENAAARRIASAATDLPAARNALGATEELVPGSKPTTFEATGDPGIGGVSREMERKYPAHFAQREAEQDAARLEHVRGLERDGNPGDLSDYLRRTMQDLDNMHQQAVATATRRAQSAADRLGGDATPEEYGATLRGHAQEAADAVRAQERGLWQAIDPHGNLTVHAAPLKTAVNDIFGSVGRSARPLSSDERALHDAVGHYGETVPFRDVADLRTWVNDALRHELRTGGNTQAYARLARLRGAIEDAITSTAENQSALEQGSRVDPATSIAARIRDWQENWYADRQAGQSYGVSVGGNVAGRSGRVSAARGGEGQAGVGPGNASRDQSVQGAPFDADAQSRLNAATQATRNRVDTFNRGPVGQVLRKDGRQDQYRLPDSAVSAKIFHPGPRGFEDVQAYRQAVGDENAMQTLQDYAASSLRQRTARPDGTLDPIRVQNWLRAHSEALRAFPELQTRFRDAASASEAIGTAMAARRAALEAHETGAIAKVMRVSGDDDVSRTVGIILGSSTRTQQMQQLADATARNPDARAGLRKAVANYMQEKFVTGGNGKADQFLKFLRASNPALRSIFNRKELDGLNALAVDMLRTSAKSPVTASSGQSLLKNLVTEGIGAGIGAASSAHSPLAGWLTAKVVNRLRDAGISRVDEVVRDAMLNPNLAYALLAKGKPSPVLVEDLAKALGGASMAAGGAVMTEKRRAPTKGASPSNPQQNTYLDRYGISLSP